MVLDTIDWRILEHLQTDNTIPNIELASRVGLSAPACSRRVARMRREGVIRRDVSVVDPKQAGYPIQVIVSVKMSERQKTVYDGFLKMVGQHPEIRYCAKVAGSIDFVLHVNVGSVRKYSELSRNVFIDNPNVGEYESWIVLEEIKDEPTVVRAG
ncbi:MAG: Lrp/AsnC family transcriptional regulator [Hyphomicrobiales bacterium]|nr:Lrp/AsnC family transcriptional regulator [Hyphomicrobiales bacterium]